MSDNTLLSNIGLLLDGAFPGRPGDRLRPGLLPRGPTKDLTPYLDMTLDKCMPDKLRITDATLDVLEVLLDSPEEWYGFKIAQKIGRSTGSVFTILARLERGGWAVSDWETRQPSERGALKRLYRLNPEGAVKARAVLADRRSPAPTETRDEITVSCPGLLRPRAEGAS